MENPGIRITKNELLSNNWYVLRKITYDYTHPDGRTESQIREVYDRGNGATILLFNKKAQTVLLIRQLRLPTYFNGNPGGMLIESCAGLLDAEDAETGIRRETEEETGYRVQDIKHVFKLYMSPGSVTETIDFFVAEYSDAMRTGSGGGVDHEQENIELVELDFKKALHMVETGEICDAKTVILLQYAQLNGLLD